MPSGMHLFFVGSPADSTPFKTGWLTSENIKKPRHGIDNHFLNLEYNPTVLPDTVDGTALSLEAFKLRYHQSLILLENSPVFYLKGIDAACTLFVEQAVFRAFSKPTKRGQRFKLSNN